MAVAAAASSATAAPWTGAQACRAFMRAACSFLPLMARTVRSAGHTELWRNAEPDREHGAAPAPTLLADQAAGGSALPSPAYRAAFVSLPAPAGSLLQTPARTRARWPRTSLIAGGLAISMRLYPVSVLPPPSSLLRRAAAPPPAAVENSPRRQSWEDGPRSGRLHWHTGRPRQHLATPRERRPSPRRLSTRAVGNNQCRRCHLRTAPLPRPGFAPRPALQTAAAEPHG